MAIAQSYKVSVSESGGERTAVFYRTDNDAYDLRYGWGRYTSSLHSSLDDAIEDFRSHLQAEHDEQNDGITVSLGSPIEIDEEEAKSLSPSTGTT